MEPIVIIGGGIIGSGLAYYLRHAPAEVVLLEKNSLGSGTTSASIAVFSWLSSHPDEFAHQLKETAWKEYQPLIERDEISFEQCGALIVAESEENLQELRNAADQLRQYGLEVDIRLPNDLVEFNLNPDRVAGAIHTPDEGYLDPAEIIQYWTRKATEAGVEIKTEVPVTDIYTDDATVTAVETVEGVIEAGTIINAAGPWSPQIGQMVDITLPIRHTYGRILVLQLEEDFSLPFVTFENGEYFREEGANQAFAGRVETDFESAVRVNPDEVHSIEEEFRLSVAQNTSEFVPILEDAQVTNEWVGLRAVTPDADPVIGPTEVDGFLTATGMSGMGITLAPAVTSALADYILTGSNEIVNRLGVSRFD